MLIAKKKLKKRNKQGPITLPRISESDLTFATVKKHLEALEPIWLHYNFLDGKNAADGMPNPDALLALERGRDAFDGFTVLRLEESKYIVKYDVYIFQDNPENPDPHLKVVTVWPYRNTVILDLLANDLRNASHIYYDNIKYTAALPAYRHKPITEDMLQDAFISNGKLDITKDFFTTYDKRPDTNDSKKKGC
jgi:hypothetical protein